MAKHKDNHDPNDLKLDQFEGQPDDQGLSLDELSESFARLLGEGSDPYDEASSEGDHSKDSGDGADSDESTDPTEVGSLTDADDSCPISPLSILEALLFVGHPENQPLTSQHIASLMRGVSPREVDELVIDLNQFYEDQHCAFYVESVDTGYRMSLRQEFLPLKEKFYGRIREAKLSQAAIDVLSVVAYNQPVTTDDVSKLRGKPSGAILNQMVRRELLCVKMTEGKPRRKQFQTTDRFLALFGLESVDHLPRTSESEVG